MTDDSLDPSLLIGPAGGAKIDRKTVMPREVEKLAVVNRLGFSADNDAFEIVVAAAVRDAADLPKSLYMAFQEELHGRPGIEPTVKVAAIGEDKDKPVNHPEGEPALHPVHLGFFAGKELKLMICAPPFPAPGPCELLYGGVSARESIRSQTLQDLDGLQGGISQVPLPDQMDIGSNDAAGFPSRTGARLDQPPDLFP